MVTRYAESLAEIYHHIHEIHKGIKLENKDKGPERSLLWFRGHAVDS